MESVKKGQRKRKSGGVGDIFEVSDKDLSPEPEEIDNDEPEAKILKIRNSDVSESRENNVEHNPKNEKAPINEIKMLLEEPQVKSCGDDPNSKIEKPCEDHSNSIIEICDNTDDDDSVRIVEPSLDPQNLNDNTLEDGEVNDSILDESVLSPQTSDPLITIKFDNKSIAEIYKVKFLKFIQTFIELEVQKVDETTISISRNLCVKPDEWIVLDASDTPYLTKTSKDIELDEELAKELPVTPQTDSPKKKKKKKKPKLKQTELFVVDTNPGINTQKSVATKYSTKFLIDEKQNETEAISKPSVPSTCFNCENNHSLKDCPQPKNYGKINANRQKFANKNKSSRYHLEEEQKYSHLQPGKITPALRKALGLKKNQMPSYIYQMRLLGYPPGWLEDAKVVDSELAMFDIDGNNVKNTNAKKIKGLDPGRVINYPGFNIPLEKEFKDEYKYHRVPPYSEQYSKEKMIDYFKKQCLRDEDDLETQDMDLDNTNDLSIVDVIEEIAEVKPIQNKQLESLIDSDSNNVPSPSLNDLEKEKDSLLAELTKPEEPIPWEYRSEDASLSSSGEQKEGRDESKDEKSKHKEAVKDKSLDEETDPVEVVMETVCESTETNIEIKISKVDQLKITSSPIRVNCVKSSTFGTPIIKSNTPYDRLPNPTNFSIGVSPVIDFENLPNSTGKYEQMTGILQKVRDTLKKNPDKSNK